MKKSVNILKNPPHPSAIFLMTHGLTRMQRIYTDGCATPLRALAFIPQQFSNLTV
jgi:hypothetical protein